MIEDALRRIIREELEDALDTLRESLGASHPATAPSAAPELLTTAEAAELARVTPETLRSWVAAGRLPKYRSGRRVLVRRSDLLDLLRTDGNDPIAEAVEAELRLLHLR